MLQRANTKAGDVGDDKLAAFIKQAVESIHQLLVFIADAVAAYFAVGTAAVFHKPAVCKAGAAQIVYYQGGSALIVFLVIICQRYHCAGFAGTQKAGKNGEFSHDSTSA